MSRSLLIALIPIITGLCAAIYTRIIAESFMLMGLLYILNGLGVLLVCHLSGHSLPNPATLNPVLLAPYVLLNVALSFLWMYASTFEKVTDTTPVGLVEITWPIFSALFMWFLFDIFSLTRVQIAGGFVALVGVGIVVIGTPK
jgi:drug/metabolite transporter (DMT)-like permease